MIALLQRVTAASVEVAGQRIAAIGRGLVVFVGVEAADGERNADRLAQRVCAYRVFPDAEGRMNICVADAGGDVLAVPQFTLAADTEKGTRASFTSAAAPDIARHLFELFVAGLRAGVRVECGRFAADMNVSLVNQGPVTFWLRA